MCTTNGEMAEAVLRTMASVFVSAKIRSSLKRRSSFADHDEGCPEHRMSATGIHPNGRYRPGSARFGSGIKEPNWKALGGGARYDATAGMHVLDAFVPL